jgi:hypothetical protein
MWRWASSSSCSDGANIRRKAVVQRHVTEDSSLQIQLMDPHLAEGYKVGVQIKDN